tara:strand:- start:5 stop:286 length:282 start_codon:yes stop_codon:yes gene_type:complete
MRGEMISRVLPNKVRKLHNETNKTIGTQLLTQADKEHFEDMGYFEAFNGDEYFKSDKFVSDLLSVSPRQFKAVKESLKIHNNIDVDLVIRSVR